MVNNKKIIAVVPAYNAARTLEMTLNAIPRQVVDDIIVVDDGSQDDTSAVAQKNSVKILVHAKNQGYGASQKTGYREALNTGADIVVMVHSDFQYDPTLIPAIIRPIVEGEADACFGSRMRRKKDALKGGMPWWRFFANVGLTFIEEFILRLGLSEYHTGYRAYSRQVLVAIPFDKNSNNYVFDTEMIAQLKIGRFRVAEIPIPTRYLEHSSSPNFIKSIEYGLMTLGVLLKYLLHSFRLRSYPQFVITPSLIK